MTDAELDAQAERNQARYERRQLLQHLAHPDCRDPDHRGCSRCEEKDDDEQD